jgi:hypothetical protein
MAAVTHSAATAEAAGFVAAKVRVEAHVAGRHPTGRLRGGEHQAMLELIGMDKLAAAPTKVSPFRGAWNGLGGN